MVDAARQRARDRNVPNATFLRMDAGQLALPDASFDVALCALGLMYVPDPAQALAEMRRVLRPGGRVALAVWGERARCGWAGVFPIVDDEVASDVCPLFFRLGQGDALARRAERPASRFEQHRIDATLDYESAEAACDAAFVGGPVALAWSRFDAPRASACAGATSSRSHRGARPCGYRVPARVRRGVGDRADPGLTRRRRGAHGVPAPIATYGSTLSCSAGSLRATTARAGSVALRLIASWGTPGGT